MSLSLRARVTIYVLAVIALVVVPLGVVIYRTSIQEFEELGDARLVQATRTIDVLAENAGLRNPQPGAPLDVLVWRSPFPGPVVTAAGHAYEALLGFQFWNGNDQLRVTSDNFETVALDATPHGFADVELNGSLWRVFTLREEDGDTIRVAERYDSRNAIAHDLLWQHSVPLLLALPLLVVLIGWAVRRALRPLDTLSRELAVRQPDSSLPVQLSPAPRELAPVLGSLNGLLARIGASLARERQFADNAAHQLRTPLASAMLHLENAVAADSDEARNLALTRASEGLGRLRRMVNQFLDFARWDTVGNTPPCELVDLLECARAEVEEAALLAAHKDLEVSVVADVATSRVAGWEPALRALLRNLIDNAFRYTPDGGQVEVRLRAGAAGTQLEVSDSGPGIAPEERAAVLCRFNGGDAATGHGLGLSIAKRVAELHGATLELRDSRFGRGLCVAVAFPTLIIPPSPPD